MTSNSHGTTRGRDEHHYYLWGLNRLNYLQSIAVAVLIFLVGCRYDGAEVVPTEILNPKIVLDITDVLLTQQNDWNNGDREAFMESYWHSDSLRFVSSGSVNYGWQATLDNYHRRYPTQASMGILTFSELEVRPLNASWATVFGRFTLVRSEQGGGDLTGLFTLILEHQPGGWKIVQDHTSIP